MTEIYVYGAGNNGVRLLERIRQYYNNEICIKAFIDSQKDGVLNDVPIVPIDAKRDPKNPVVISIENRSVVSDVYVLLKRQGVDRVYLYLNRHNPRYSDDSFLDNECSEITCEVDELIPHIEMHAVDYCNLNCKACIHYSALYSKDEFDGSIIFSDIDAVSKLTNGIVSFYIMGGEPLLREDLDEVVRYSRKAFPKSDIQVLTNGLLINDSLSKLWEAMRDCNATLTISEYRPTVGRRKAITEILEKNKVCYFVRPYNIKDRFVKTLCIDKDAPYKKICICQGCINVYRGTVARCPAIMYLDRLNETFNITLPGEGVYDLDDFATVTELRSKMSERIPLCDHCVDYEIEWDQCKKEKTKEDFLVME